MPLIFVIDVSVSVLVQPIDGEPIDIFIFFEEVTCFVDIVELNFVDGDTFQCRVFCFFFRLNKQVWLILDRPLKPYAVLISDN